MQSGSGKGVIGATYTVPDDLTGTTDSLTVTLAQDTFPITWNVIGNGSVTAKVGANNVNSAQKDAIVSIVAQPDTGYKWAAGYPKARMADGTEISLSAYDPTTWNFQMPASAVSIEAVFEADNTATVTFTNSSATAGAKAAVAIAEGSIALDKGDSSGPWNLTTGTVVTILPMDGYDTVNVTDGNGFDKTGASVTYTLPAGTTTVTIKVSSSAKAVTVKSMTNGTVNLRKNNVTTDPTYVAGNFAAGDPLYIEVVPVKGYQLKPDSLKVMTNIGDTNILVPRTAPPSTIQSTLAPSPTTASRSRLSLSPRPSR